MFRIMAESNDANEGGVDTSSMIAEAVDITADLIRIDSTNTGNLDTIGDGETRVCRRIAASAAALSPSSIA